MVLSFRHLAAILTALCFPLLLQAQEAMPTPDAALKLLQEGNARFVAGKSTMDNSAKRRAELAKGQKPFAIVLACADSRVTPELIFDEGLGKIFVIRVAGNVTDPEMLGSIEYGIEHLKAPLIVVLGHEKCGAVDAALSGAKLNGNLEKLIARVHVAKDLGKNKEANLTASIAANAKYQTAQLTKQSTVIKDFAVNKRIRIVTGVYSLSTGKVEWLDK